MGCHCWPLNVKRASCGLRESYFEQVTSAIVGDNVAVCEGEVLLDEISGSLYSAVEVVQKRGVYQESSST